MHIRYYAHILNLIVTKGLKKVDDSIARVRSVVKYVKSSPGRFENFKGCIERKQLTFKGLLCLDVPTRWNSTFFILEGAEKCQAAFQLMEEFDKIFKLQRLRKKHEKKGLRPLTCAYWNCIRIFLKFLKNFIMSQCDFRGLCIVHIIYTSKKFVAFKCIYKSILIQVIMY